MARLTWKAKPLRLRHRPSTRSRRPVRMINVVEREPVSADTRLHVWQRDGGCCQHCGSTRRLHFDHIVPVSWGGASNAENVELLCEQCNLSKGARLIVPRRATGHEGPEV